MSMDKKLNSKNVEYSRGKEVHAKSILDYLLLNVSRSFD